eukprot:1474871-Prymnesium_polylepis.1
MSACGRAQVGVAAFLALVDHRRRQALLDGSKLLSDFRGMIIARTPSPARQLPRTLRATTPRGRG